MSSVEDKIVSMKFDNSQFEPAARQTMSTLDRLKAALSFGGGKSAGLSNIQSQVSGFNLGGIASAVSGVSKSFLAMSAVAIAAISHIVIRAVDAGLRIAKALTFQPVLDGFHEYETQLNAVQTILANTQAAGTKLKDVNSALNQLNTYSDKTIYNFTQMARNVGTFTAAGVGLNTSVAAIKGIANLAALSGSNSEQASTAMYQLSQAISAGRVKLQDWNSVVNAGMGGTVFQRALAQTAQKMGTLSKGAVELHGKMKNVTIAGHSFRDSLSDKKLGKDGWLTSKVLTETLKQFTGDLKDADLAAMGFSKSEIKAIQAQAKTAQDAATQVKTFSQLIQTLQEAAGSGWAQSFAIVVGDFKEAKKLWTEVSNVAGGFLNRNAKARNKMLQDWKDLGGRGALIKGLVNLFKSIVQVVTPIGKAFRDIFPATTGKQLFAMTKAFLDFTKNLKLGKSTLDDIRRTARGFFAVLDIGIQIILGIIGFIGKLFGVVAEGGGSFLEMTGNVGDFLVHLDKVIKKGNLVNKFFNQLALFIATPIRFLKALAGAFIDFFGNLHQNPFKVLAEHMGRLGDRLGPLASIAHRVGAVWGKLVQIFSAVGKVLAPIGTMIGKLLSGIGDAIAKAFKAGNFSSVFDAVNTVLLAGIVVLINKFMKTGLKFDLGGGFVKSIRETFGALTGTLTAMQNQINSKTLLNIAIAVGILTVSLVALSLIDSKKLSKALAGIGFAMAELLGAMKVLDTISTSVGFAKIPIMAASMILLSTALLILTAALKIISTMSWEDISKGMITIGASMLILVTGLNAMQGGLLGAAALVVTAVALTILAGALKIMATMSWEQIAKGMVVMAGALLIMAGGLTLMDAALPGAAALLVAAAGFLILAPALKIMSSMKWGEIAKGMVVLAGSLIIMAVGLTAMIASGPGAAALVVASGALIVLSGALKIMATMSWGQIAKGLVVLAASLLIMAVGLTAMIAALPGAAALVVAAAGLTLMVPVLAALGAMSWEAIAKGLAAIAGTFLILGVAGLVLAPVVPTILALAAALLLLGAGMALIGVGALAVATAFSIIAAAGTAGVAVLLAMINLIPRFMAKFAEGIIGFATTLASQAGKFTAAFTILLVSLLTAVIKIMPKLGQALQAMITLGLNILQRNGPRMAQVGVFLLTMFLVAIRSRIGTLVSLAAQIIIRFLTALNGKIPGIVKVGVQLIVTLMGAISKSQGKLLSAGAKMIISFINGLASTIRSNSSKLHSAGVNLALAIIDGITGGLASFVGRAASAAASMAKQALAAAKAAIGVKSPSKAFYEVGKMISLGMAFGIDDFTHISEKSAEGMSTSVLDTMKGTMENIQGMLPGVLELNPTIKPILDLSLVTQDATKLNGLLDEKSVAADLSYRQALGISAAQIDSANVEIVGTSSGGDTYLTFEQHNTSPKALSPIEIYRDTKSVLSQAKEALSNI